MVKEVSEKHIIAQDEKKNLLKWVPVMHSGQVV